MGFLRRLFSRKPPDDGPPAPGRWVRPPDPPPPDPVIPGPLAEKLVPFWRTGWLAEAEDGDGETTASKFSGLAHIPKGESWPRCGSCDKPMQLFVQLNAKDLPEGARELHPEGILQFFYCTDPESMCDVDCEGWRPFSKASLARVITEGSGELISASPVKDAFPAKSITGWKTVEELPDLEELEYSLGIKLDDSERKALETVTILNPGEKLGGWPYWIQGVEYPDCPKCGEPMGLVFQVDSDQNLPFLFGDLGVGHITRCKRHPEVLGFGWACT